MIYLSTVLITLRPWQWIKNGLLFVPLVFALRIGEISEVYVVCISFGIFCLASSAVYCVNDIFDAKTDLNDAVNKDRPVASGALGMLPVAGLSIVLLGVSVMMSYIYVSPSLTVIVATYYFINLLYSAYLKTLIQWGVIIVSLGFVLRVYAGAVVIDLELSSWLILVTFFTALFISLIKRKNKHLSNPNVSEDPGIVEYFDASINITAALVIIIYCLWVILGQQIFNDQRMLISIPFVICGILRFMMLMREGNSMRDPTILLIKDTPLLLTFIAWFVVCFVALYFEKVF